MSQRRFSQFSFPSFSWMFSEELGLEHRTRRAHETFCLFAHNTSLLHIVCFSISYLLWGNFLIKRCVRCHQWNHFAISRIFHSFSSSPSLRPLKYTIEALQWAITKHHQWNARVTSISRIFLTELTNLSLNERFPNLKFNQTFDVVFPLFSGTKLWFLCGLALDSLAL